MGVTASAMDSRVQVRRATLTPDGYGGQSYDWGDHGDPIHCLREDVKDTEAVLAGVFRSRLMARFHVRSTAFTRDITTGDRVVADGITFAIVGIKRPLEGRRQLLEISAEEITP